MTDVNHVIEAIDHALEDYGTSGDAMRWTPEPHPEIILNETASEEIVPSYMDVVRTAVWQLAVATGIPRFYYSRWEAGRPADHTERIPIDIVLDERIHLGDYLPAAQEGDDGP